MGWNDHLDDDDGFGDFLREILPELDDPAAGITKLVIDKGQDILSEKQNWVFQKNVLDLYVTKECKRCGIDIPWCEMYGAHDNGGYCGYCAHMMAKDDRL